MTLLAQRLHRAKLAEARAVIRSALGRLCLFALAVLIGAAFAWAC